MADRKDLPQPGASNFGGRVREELMRLMGKIGDSLDQAITKRDLVAAGFAQIRPGTQQIEPAPGIGGPAEREPDLTPPPQPTGFTATGAISHVLIEHASPTYTQGGGHLRTRVYGAQYTSGPLPTFADAVEVGQFSGTVWGLASNPGTTWRLWIKWETADGVLSPTPAGGTNGLAETTGQDVSAMVRAMTGPGNPFTILTQPTTIDGVTYAAGTYSVQSFILDAQITTAKIANLAVDDAKIANLSVTKLTAGSLAVGQHIQSTGYVAGSAGWRINADGTAELSNATVRGAIFAGQGTVGGWTIGSNYLQSGTYALGTSGTRFNSDGTGQIGGITIYAQGIGAGSTAYDLGNGSWLGRDGKLSLKSSTNFLKWDGESLSVSGSLIAATGTFSGQLSAATGTFSGALTANAINAVNTINLAGNAVTVPVSAFANSTVVGNGGWQTVLSAALAASGGNLYIHACLDGEPAAVSGNTGETLLFATQYARILVNGVERTRMRLPASIGVSFAASGLQTIELQYYGPPPNSANPAGGTATTRSIFAIETKR